MLIDLITFKDPSAQQRERVVINLDHIILIRPLEENTAGLVEATTTTTEIKVPYSFEKLTSQISLACTAGKTYIWMGDV